MGYDFHTIHSNFMNIAHNSIVHCHPDVQLPCFMSKSQYLYITYIIHVHHIIISTDNDHIYKNIDWCVLVHLFDIHGIVSSDWISYNIAHIPPCIHTCSANSSTGDLRNFSVQARQIGYIGQYPEIGRHDSLHFPDWKCLSFRKYFPKSFIGNSSALAQMRFRY